MDEFKFAQITEAGRVDKEKGVIFGVSLISTPEAKGHGVKIDKATIESFYNQVDGKSIKAYYTHDDENEALDSIGLWENFEIVEDGEYTKLTADFVALDSWKTHHSDLFDALFELAEKAPEAFGVSAEFFASRVFYNEDGEEQEWKGEEDVDVYARAVDVSAFSIVAMPSANPTGLFSVNAKTVSDDDVDIEEFLSFNLTKTQDDLKATEQELKLAKDAVVALETANAELEVDVEKLKADLEEAEEKVEASQKEVTAWQVKYAKAISDMGSEPVEFSSEEAPKTFAEKLAQCKTYAEKSKLFAENMNELVSNPNWNQ